MSQNKNLREEQRQSSLSCIRMAGSVSTLQTLLNRRLNSK
jgi:hypothetical protein